MQHCRREVPGDNGGGGASLGEIPSSAVAACFACTLMRVRALGHAVDAHLALKRSLCIHSVPSLQDAIIAAF